MRNGMGTRRPSAREAHRYDAFLSYSHRRDKDLAHALKRGLQRLACPWWRLRALNAFLDDSDLAATPSLWGTIQGALDRSRHLVLLASPEAAASPWVARELGRFLERNGPSRLFLVVTSGGAHWDREAGTWAWEASPSVPRCLDGAFTEDPLWVDLRGVRERGSLSSRNPEFQHALARLAAPMRGSTIEALIGKDVRLHRRAVRTAWVGALLVMALALVATWQTRVAESARDRAERNLREARRSLAETHLARARTHEAAGRCDEALRSTARAHATDPSVASRLDVTRAFGRLQGTVAWESPHPFEGFSGIFATLAGSQEVVGPVGGDFVHWDTASGRVLRRWRAQDHPIAAFDVSEDGSRVASVDAEGTLRVHDLPGGGPLRLERTGGHRGVALDPTGTRVAVVRRDGTLAALRVEDGTTIWTASREHRDLVRVWFREGDDAVWALDRREGVWRFTGAGIEASAVRPPPEAFPDETGGSDAIDLDSGDADGETDAEGAEVPANEVVEDGQGEEAAPAAWPEGRRTIGWIVGPASSVLAVLWEKGPLDLLDATTGEILRVIPRELVGRHPQARTLTLSRKGDRLAWLDGNGSLVVEDLERGERRVLAIDREGEACRGLCAAFTADGRSVLVAAQHGAWPDAWSAWSGSDPVLEDASYRLHVLPLEDGALGAPPVPGYAAAPTSLAFHPAGEHVAVGTTDGGIALFDAVDGSMVGRTRPHAAPVVGLAYDAAGTRLVSADERGVVAVTRGEETTALPAPGVGADRRVTAFAADPHDRWVALATTPAPVPRPPVGRTARPDRRGEGGAPGTETDTRPTLSAAELRRQREEHAVLVLDPSDGRVRARLLGPTLPLRALAASGDGRTLYGAANLLLFRWDLGDVVDGTSPAAPREVVDDGVGMGAPIASLRLVGNDASLLVGLATGTVLVADAYTLQVVQAIPVATRPVSATDATAGSTLLIAGTGSVTDDLLRARRLEAGRILLWDPVTQRIRAEYQGHPGGIVALALSPDGRDLATVGHDGRVRMTSLSFGTRLQDVGSPGSDPTLVTVAASAEGRLLVQGGAWDVAEGRIRFETRVLDLRNLLVRHVLETSEENDLILRTPRLSADGRYVLRVRPDPVGRLWTLRAVLDLDGVDEATHEEIEIPLGAGGELVGPKVGFSEDLETVWAAVSGRPLGNRLVLFDAATGEPRGTTALPAAPEIVSLAHAPDDGHVVDAAGHLFRVRDASALALPPDTEVLEMRRSAEDRWLLLVTTAGEVLVLDPEEGRLEARLAGVAHQALHVAPTPSPDRFLTASAGGAVALWSASERRCLWEEDVLPGPVDELVGTTHGWVVAARRQPPGGGAPDVRVLDLSRVEACARRLRQATADEVGAWGDGWPERARLRARGRLPGAESPAPTAPAWADALEQDLAALRRAEVEARAEGFRAGLAQATPETKREAVDRERATRMPQLVLAAAADPHRRRRLAEEWIAHAPREPQARLALVRALRDLVQAGDPAATIAGLSDATHDAMSLAAGTALEQTAAAEAAPVLAATRPREATGLYRVALRDLGTPGLPHLAHTRTYGQGLLKLARYAEAADVVARARGLPDLAPAAVEELRIFETTARWAARVQEAAPRLPVLAVRSVAPLSPGARAGLRADDLLLSLDGRAYEHPREVSTLVAAALAPVSPPGGRPTRLRVLREGRAVDVDAPAGIAGAEILELWAPCVWTVAVQRVPPDSAARAAGMQPGDLVARVDGVPIHGVREALAAAGAGRPDVPCRLDVVRWRLTPQGLPARPESGPAAEEEEEPFASWAHLRFPVEIPRGDVRDLALQETFAPVYVERR